MKAFSGEAQCFIDQYGNYTVPELEDILGEDAHVSNFFPINVSTPYVSS